MENLTVAQLKEVCLQKNIHYTSKATKSQLITLINGAKQQEPVARVGKSFRGEY